MNGDVDTVPISMLSSQVIAKCEKDEKESNGFLFFFGLKIHQKSIPLSDSFVPLFV